MRLLFLIFFLTTQASYIVGLRINSYSSNLNMICIPTINLIVMVYFTGFTMINNMLLIVCGLFNIFSIITWLVAENYEKKITEEETPLV